MKLTMPDKVSVLGLCIATGSLVAFPFVTFRPNRVFAGTPLTGLDSLGGFFWVMLLLLILLALSASLRRDGGYPLHTFTGLMASVYICVAVFCAGYAANILASPEMPHARTSLGAGFWLTAFGAYLVIVAAIKGMSNRSPLSWLVRILPLAVPAGMLFAGWLDALSIMQEFFNRRATFFTQFSAHVTLSFSSVFLGTLVGIVLAILAFRLVKAERYMFAFINLFQTVPTLSFLGLLMLPLAYLGNRYALFGDLGVTGIGWAPAFIVLFAYTLLPVTGNALAGFRIVDPMVVEAARGMGMTSRQVFMQIQMPLALPVILSGIRTALTQAIGNTILAGLIGGGGMGTIIFLGLAQSAPDLILLGALPVVALALAADGVLRVTELLLHRRMMGES